MPGKLDHALKSDTFPLNMQPFSLLMLHMIEDAVSHQTAHSLSEFSRLNPSILIC